MTTKEALTIFEAVSLMKKYNPDCSFEGVMLLGLGDKSYQDFRNNILQAVALSGIDINKL
ncbi:MAG: hypothetical protein ACLGJB_03635 [Blastocatellia bacterium]